MTKQIILAFFGYCVLLGSLVAQNSDNQPAISIQLSKMDVVYLGIDNPIQVFAGGLSSAEYRVQTDKGSLVSTGMGKYNLKVPVIGEVTLSVYTKTGPAVLKQKFRVKRIPDPIPSLGARYSKSDTMEIGQFKAQMGLALVLENFDFDAKCDMVEYKITHIGTNGLDGKMVSHTVLNKGARFGTEASELISNGAIGDIYIFNEIKGRCPGDIKDRELNALVFFMGEKK